MMAGERLAELRQRYEQLLGMTDALPWKLWGNQLRSGPGADYHDSRLIASFESRQAAIGPGSNVANLYLAQLAVNAMGELLGEITRLRER